MGGKVHAVKVVAQTCACYAVPWRVCSIWVVGSGDCCRGTWGSGGEAGWKGLVRVGSPRASRSATAHHATLQAQGGPRRHARDSRRAVRRRLEGLPECRILPRSDVAGDARVLLERAGVDGAALVFVCDVSCASRFEGPTDHLSVADFVARGAVCEAPFAVDPVAARAQLERGVLDLRHDACGVLPSVQAVVVLNIPATLPVHPLLPLTDAAGEYREYFLGGALRHDGSEMRADGMDRAGRGAGLRVAVFVKDVSRRRRDAVYAAVGAIEGGWSMWGRRSSLSLLHALRDAVGQSGDDWRNLVDVVRSVTLQYVAKHISEKTPELLAFVSVDGGPVPRHGGLALLAAQARVAIAAAEAEEKPRFASFACPAAPSEEPGPSAKRFIRAASRLCSATEFITVADAGMCGLVFAQPVWGGRRGTCTVSHGPTRRSSASGRSANPRGRICGLFAVARGKDGQLVICAAACIE